VISVERFKLDLPPLTPSSAGLWASISFASDLNLDDVLLWTRCPAAGVISLVALDLRRSPD
jgi:hypothetical protein